LVGQDKIRIVAGSHLDGMSVDVNGASFVVSSDRMKLNQKDAVIFHPQADKLIIVTPLFELELVNSDYFFNLRVSLLDHTLLVAGSTPLSVDSQDTGATVAQTYPIAHIHGLIGQTWKNIKYDSGLMYEGTIDDYIVVSRNVLDPKFPYSLFVY